MENLQLNYYKYFEELRQFNRLDVGGSYINFTKELILTIEYLEDNLIKYEVDENQNIQIL